MKNVMRTGALLLLAFAMLALVGCGSKTADTGETLPGGGGEGTKSQAWLDAENRISSGVVYFEYDSYALREDSKQVLGEVARLMKEFPGMALTIEGHCDERGTEEYNLALGERRARAAVDFLAMNGVQSSRLTPLSYGESHPVASGNNESAWAQNRRSQFRP